MNFNEIVFFAFILTLFVFACGIISIKTYEFFLFKYDETNPYRRHCKRCGQCQNEHGESMNDPRGWWEVNGTIINADCDCHCFASPY